MGLKLGFFLREINSRLKLLREYWYVRGNVWTQARWSQREWRNYDTRSFVFFVTSRQYTCHARRIVLRKAVRWKDDIKMNLLNIVWILGYLATLLQLLHSVESDDNMIMDIRRPRSGFGRRLLCLMSRCPLDQWRTEGGFGVFKLPPPRNSEVLTKLHLIANWAENV